MAQSIRPWVPPRWFVRPLWAAHRAIYRLTGGRRGLAHPKQGGQFGYLRLVTAGRRSGRPRVAILGYVEDGHNFVTLAMNAWANPDPAWWLNLRARARAEVELKGGDVRPVQARAADGQERPRLLALLKQHRGWGDIDAYMEHRATETAVVVLEPLA